MKTFDVAIIGSGPAGASAALKLAEHAGPVKEQVLRYALGL